MSTENVEIVKALFAAWEARDPEAAEGLLDPDIEVNADAVNPPGLGGTRRGKEAFREFWRSWLSEMDSFKFHPENFIDGGSHVVVLMHMEGRGRKSGVSFERRGAAVYTLRDGLVVSLRAFNTLAAATEFAEI
jgi:ketosteroid isomerase-like protein